MARAAGELPGSVPPERRLAVTPRSGPGDRPGLTSRLGRPDRIRLPSAFPLARPTWPGAVPRPPVEKTLGMAYDSDWARRPPPGGDEPRSRSWWPPRSYGRWHHPG